MSGRGGSAEKHILELFKNHNRPFNVQIVTDFLAQHGIKKTQVQKTLDAMCEDQKITSKEFGKTRIYWPLQTSKDDMSNEVIDERKKELKTLNTAEQEKAAEMNRLGKGKLLLEYSDLMAIPTLTEMEIQSDALIHRKDVIVKKLDSLRSNPDLVSPGDRIKVEKSLNNHLHWWRKWKSAFMEIWNTVFENMECKRSELMEEMGVDTDEDVGCSLDELNTLFTGKRRRYR